MTHTIPLRVEQQQAVEQVKRLDGKCGLWMEMGTGKTRTALAILEEFNCRRVLVVCPIHVANVWELEVRKLGLHRRVVDLTSGALTKRKELLLRESDAIVLVNYQAYWREPFRSAILKWEPEAVILDESQNIKHRGPKQSRFAGTFPNKPFVRVRLAMSGTPITNGLQDAWSQYRFIDPTIFGPYQRFESRYIKLGGAMGREIVGYQNEDDFRKLIDAHSFQCRKDESSLPPRMDIPVPVQMRPETRKVYNELRDKSIVKIDQAEGQSALVVTEIALTTLLRLQQITSGFVHDEDGNVVELSTEKLDATIPLVQSAVEEGQRVVIFCRWLHDIDVLTGVLGLWLDNKVVERVDGRVQRSKVKDTLKRFREGKVDVLVAQIKSVSTGVDLTAASIGIFYSVGFSLEDFLQARDRLHREGQKKPVTYYHMLVGPKTVDTKVYVALQMKLNIASAVTNLSYAKVLFT